MKRKARSEPMDFSHDIFPRVEPFLHKTIKNHGKNPFLWIGTRPMVVITEAELAKEVFSRMSDFHRPYFRISALLAPGLASYEGEIWSKHRKLVNPAFHMEKLKLMVPAFQTSCIDMINKWEALVSQTGSVELDVCSHFTALSADVISRAAFGSSFEEGRKAFELIKEQTELYNKMTLELIVPLVRYLPTSTNKRFNKAQKGIQSIIESVIDKRRRQMEAGEATQDDLLGLLMRPNVEKQQNEQYLEITTEKLIDECKLFYTAGQETTSAFLTFTVIMLSKYTDWQALAREEVLKIFGQNTPDFEGIKHLKIVSMILYEVLRLYPSAASVSRTTKADTRVGNLFLPAGTFISLPLLSTHNDPQQWGEDSTEFKPERFSQGSSTISREGVGFRPFGWGPRMCVGKNFALLEAKITLAMILQRFSFQLSPSYVHAPTTSFTLRPQFGAQIIFHRLH